jgi:hypothetical protein
MLLLLLLPLLLLLGCCQQYGYLPDKQTSHYCASLAAAVGPDLGPPL